MKRFLAGLVSLSLVAAGLSGCGGEVKPSAEQGKQAAAVIKEPVRLVFWNFWTGGAGDFAKAMVDEFNKTHPDIQVEMSSYESKQYYPKLTTSFTGGDTADVAVLFSSLIPSFASKGMLTPLDAELKRAQVDGNDFAERPWKATVYEGKQYGIPLDLAPMLSFWNLDLAEKAGLAKDGKVQLPEGKEQFLAAVKTLQEKTGKAAFPVEAGSTFGFRLWYSLITQNGVKLFTEDLKKSGFNTPEGIEATQFLVDLIHQHKVSPSGLKYLGAQKMFLSKDAAILPQGTGGVGKYDESGLRFAAMPFPKVFKTNEVFGDTHVLVLMAGKKDARRTEASITFTKWLSDNSVLWAKSGHLPIRKSVLNSSEFKSLPHRSEYASAVNQVVYPQPSLHLDEAIDILTEELEAMLVQKKTVPQGLKDSEKRINELLAK